SAALRPSPETRCDNQAVARRAGSASGDSWRTNMNTLAPSRRKPFWYTFSVLLLAALSFGSRSVAAQTCERLSDLKLANTTITAAQRGAAGSFPPPAGTAVPYKDLPAFCRVAGVIKPTSDSEIKFEVWMPVSGWNGKFQGVGNGGFAGSISYPALAGPLARGYASASTDTGHTGGDARWALGHPEK